MQNASISIEQASSPPPALAADAACSQSDAIEDVAQQSSNWSQAPPAIVSPHMMRSMQSTKHVEAPIRQLEHALLG
jgi:hypothetical protein